MATGLQLTHGVSGYACLGRQGDFQEQRRGEPWETIVNDPITSYLNAQSHIGVPLSNFNEPWTGGVLQDGNWSANAYRKPIFGEAIFPTSAKEVGAVEIASMDFPSHFGVANDQQLPNARIHVERAMMGVDRQNLTWEAGTMNGDNKMFLPQGQIFVHPNKKDFQGGQTSTATHPQNDVAGQQTTGNTTRTDFTGGQTPYQKLPSGQTVGQLQMGEPPALWELAPPPDPAVLPGEGTGMLAPTGPSWW